MVTPVRVRTRATASSLFSAMRKAAVATAAMARAPACFASPTMSAIASAVRSSGSGAIRPDSSSPSPMRVISARSRTLENVPSSLRSAMWNFTELVPTSMIA